MNLLPVQLKLAATSQRPVAGWLVRGATSAEWLAAAVIPLEEQETLRFLPLADPQGSLQPTAALIVSPRLAEMSAPPGCQAYGYAAEKLLVPIESAIEPPLTPDEYLAWMPDTDALFVWHPSGGLVRFDPQDVLTIFDLLVGPDEQIVDWSAARIAPAFVDRLLSVASAEPVRTMADVEAEWNQEIGPTRSMDSLPPTPGEAPLRWKERQALATAKFRAAWRGWRGSRAATNLETGRMPPGSNSILYGLVAICALVLLISLLESRLDPFSLFVTIGIGILCLLMLLGLLGGFAGGSDAGESQRREEPLSRQPRSAAPGWFDRLWNRFQQWRASKPSPAQSAGSWMQQADRALRQREIQRLLHLLAQNPDDGLRYAIPFGGEAGRGQGIAGNELVGRDLNFRLGPGSGGPVDAWEIDPQQQMQLLQRYRELAEREQRSGRHRRAAYVYSQLLGDWLSAANALKGGRYYAEAAVIYHERLKNFGEAAKCYESAGQHAAALKLYRDQHQWIAAGDLCQRLGCEAEAERDYRTAVGRSLVAGDMGTAADVLEMKLHVVEEALNVLERTWPDHTNSDHLFDHWFTITARHARHDTARQRIESLAGDTTADSDLKLLPRLQHVHQQYPDAAVQNLAKESVLHIAARHLQDATSSEARVLSQFLPPLSPQDRLLPHDCQRFVDRRRESERRPAIPKSSHASQLRMENQFPLLIVNIAEPVLSCGQGWIALEEAEANVPQTLRLISWSLMTQQARLDRGSDNRSYALVAVNEHRHEIWLQPSGTECSVSWPQRSESWRIAFPAFIPRHWLAVEPLPSGMTRVLWIDDAGLAWLSLYTADGTIARSCRFAEEWFADPAYAIPLARGAASIIPVGPDEIFAFLPVSDDEVLGECFDAEGVRIWSGVIRGRSVIGPITPGSAPMLVLAEDAVSLLEDPRQPQAGHRVLTGWLQPQSAVLPGGLFAVADDRRVAVFTAAEGRQILECAHNSMRPRAVSPAGIGRFSILRDRGEIEVWSW